MTSPYGSTGGVATSSPSKVSIPASALDVDLAAFSPLDWRQTGVAVRAWSPTREKYVGATWVAKSLVVSFAATVLLVLVAGIVITATSPTPETAEKFAATLGAMLDSLTKFSTAVFAPLLAFVLGFYFSEKKKAG